MQIRCGTCHQTIAIAPTGALPASCPHCEQRPVPERVGDYAPDHLIATGGMGEVYRAHHVELGTEVALKLLWPMSLDVSDDVRRRFAREAQLAAKVRHPGMVRVLRSDVAHDRPYLVFELVAGETLRRRIERGAVPVVEAARIAAQVADVLAAAHAQGVLHRDVKPDNVMLQPDGLVRVLDFGIARALGDDARLTRTGELVGTPEYMAPEQLLDGHEATDERTDVHAVGLLLYELLTARSPFRGANLFQALKLVESLVPRAPSQLVDDVPPALDAVVARALQKRAEDRFAGMRELHDALLDAVPAARAPQPMPAAAAPPRRRWPLALAAIAVAAAFGAGMRWFAPPPPAAPNAASENAVVDVGEPAPDASERIKALLAAGEWCDALALALRSERTDFGAARPLAREAFVLSRAAWFRAADLPPFLAASELGQQRLLLGDRLEPMDDAATAAHAALRGDDDAWRELDNPAAARLLAVRELPAAARADAFAAYALRLPIEAPEHWLARTIERHLRGAREAAERAAEMAWLSGAGEVAVLLDAALALQHAPRDAFAMRRLWNRVAKADGADCPASTLLLLRLEARGVEDIRFDPAPARALPEALRPSAIEWLLRGADELPAHEHDAVLRLAVALGAQPDFTVSPWRELGSYRQQRVQREQREAGR